MIGNVIDHYEIVAHIGGGGMGDVYRAVDLELERDVAIKCVRPELSDLEEVTARFRNEARTLARLAHPNIATVYRFFAEEDRLFLVMEYIDGQPFAGIIDDGGALPQQRAVLLVREALKGLAYAHTNHVVHRDIKPGNLMVDQENTVKVVDFGIAHLVGNARLTQVGGVVGTPTYMAPEQILGKAIDHRTDLYSIGAVLYEMLSGTPPHSANSDFELMRAHLEVVPRPVGELSKIRVPKGLQDVVARALEKDTAERFQTAEEFATALEATADEGTVYLPVSRADSHAKVSAAEIVPVGSVGQVLEPVASEPKQGMNLKQATLGAATALILAILLVMGLRTDQEGDGPRVATAILEVAGEGSERAINVDAEPPKAPNGSTRQDNSGAETDAAAPTLQDSAPASFAAIAHANITPPGAGSAEPVPKPSHTSSRAPASTSSRKQATTPVAKINQVAISAPVGKPQARVSTVKISVHKMQGTGRFSRNAGYNGAFRLSVPTGARRNMDVAEIVEIYRDGVLVREQLVATEARVPGTFKSKQRIQDMKTLDPGEYEVQLLFVTDGQTIGSHTWKLRVSG